MWYKMNIFCGTNSINEIVDVVKSILNNKDIVEGDSLACYSKMFRQYINSEIVFSFAAGRMGLYTFLKAIGIKDGDEVIVPSFTCIVVPNAIIYTGAKPVWADINCFDYNIDVNEVEKLITSKTKVIYAQHTFGNMCDIKSILNIAKKYNIYVIEDAALALGAHIDGKFAGTFGDIGYFSTDRSKVINTGQGGVVSINNKKILKDFQDTYKNVPHLDEKFVKKMALTFIIDCILNNPNIYRIGRFIYAILWRLKLLTYIYDEQSLSIPQNNYPYPARMPNLLAKIGISQLKSLKENLEYRRKIAKFYNDILNIYDDDYINNSKNIFLRYSFLVNNRDYWEKRFSRTINLGIWFKTIAAGREDRFDKIYYHVGNNKVSEYVTKHIFNLPTHRNINPSLLKKLLYELKESNDIVRVEYDRR